MSTLSNVVRFIANPYLYLGQVAFRALEDYITPDFDIPNNSGGDPLQSGDIDANTARQGSVVPEWWGRRRRFPDKIVATRTYFESRRVQVTDNFLCVGVGEYNIGQQDIFIGRTPIGSFGNDASYSLYGPGDSVSSDNRSKCWFTSREVGGTGSGAGLDLQSTNPSGSSVIASSVLFNGKSATLSGSLAEIPAFWIAGTILIIKAPVDATVTESAGYDVFSGDFQDVQPFVGMKVTLSIGDIDYALVVKTWTDNAGVGDELTFDDDAASPFASLADGSYRVSISYRGNQYKITSVSSLTINFDRLTDTGAVDGAWTGFTSRSVTDFTISSDEGGTENWIGPFHSVPEGEVTSLIEFDVFCPSGLMIIDGDGDKKTLTRNIEIEYRDSAVGGAWTSINYALTDFTRDAIGFTYQISLPYAMRPQVRLRRVEAVYSGSATYFETLQWSGLKSLLSVRPESYPGVTTIGITVRSGDRIAAATDNQISVVATRQINGADADSIEGFIEYLKDDAAIPDSQIDMPAISAISSEFWTPRSETFDYIFDTQGSVEEALGLALSAGMSTRIDKFGKMSAVREGARAEQWGLTPHNMLADLSVTVPLSQDDIYNGVDVKYINPTTWTEETVECRLSGVTATKIEEVTVDGVTSRTRAWRIGMRKLRKNVAQQYSVSGSTEMEARNFSPLQRVTVTDDILGFTGISAQIYGFSDNGTKATLTVREQLDVSSFTNPRVVVIDHSGNRSTTINPISLTDYAVTIDSSLINFVPVTDGTIDRATLMLCESTQVGYDIIISSISPTSIAETDFTGVEYSDTYYADDDNLPE